MFILNHFRLFALAKFVKSYPLHFGSKFVFSPCTIMDDQTTTYGNSVMPIEASKDPYMVSKSDINLFHNSTLNTRSRFRQ